MNLVILTGYLGADPEFRSLDSGANVCRFRLATSDSYKDKRGERKTKTYWHTCQVWGNSAETITHYFSKGDAIQVEGELTYNEWTDKEGRKRTDAVVRVGKWHFPEKTGVREEKIYTGGSNKIDTPFGKTAITDAATGETEMVAEEDLPF